MGKRHSKQNTSSSVFTYAERQMTDYGTKTQRLGLDSKRKFDACQLCLATARTPMLCTKGHIFCRECVFQNVLEQKQQIETAKREYAAFVKQLQRETAASEEAKEAKEMENYAKRKVGISIETKKRKVEDGDKDEKRKKHVKLLEDKSDRRLESPQALEKTENIIPSNDESKEMTVQRSFWLPSKAPEAKQTVADPSERTVQCQSSSPHALKIKDLTAVEFRTLDSGEKLCPSCDKAFSNSTKIDVLKRCGHALCHRCVVNFVEPASACFVCQKKVVSKDVIRLDSDGTGFSGGGGQMVATRYDSALQA
ncbi:hypothetical protein LPJ73_001350 [Coemansia sp. RSA 2703]|nr:hypothetical protein LPJ73_001350 [Coemansia sp. RSA 2703]KAJ2375404.1 hypothetical protein IW150_002569 [Coemansia sp. RSA 2607]